MNESPALFDFSEPTSEPFMVIGSFFLFLHGIAFVASLSQSYGIFVAIVDFCIEAFAHGFFDSIGLIISLLFDF